MKPNEIRALLSRHGLNYDYLSKSTDLDGFIATLVQAFHKKDEEIAQLKEALKRRDKRKLAAQNKVKRGVGRPRKYRCDNEYLMAHTLHPERTRGPKWLSTLTVDIDGTPMTDAKRRHIQKLCSTGKPAFMKRREWKTVAADECKRWLDLLAADDPKNGAE